MSIPLATFHELHRLGAFAVSPCARFAIASVARLGEDGAQRIEELWKVHRDPREAASLVLRETHSLRAPTFDAQGNLYFLSKARTDSDDAEEVQQVWRQVAGGVPEPVTDEPLGVVEYRVAADSLIVLTPILPDTPLEQMRAIARDRAKNGPSARLFQSMPVRAWDRWTGGDVLHLVHYQPDGSERRDLTPGFAHELANDHGLAWDISADGKTLATVLEREGPDRLKDSGILLIDVTTGSHSFVGCDDRVTHQSLRLSPSGSHVAATRHLRAVGKYGVTQLAVYECATGDWRAVASDWQAVPSIEAYVGDDSLLVCAPTKGDVALFRVSLATGAVELLAGDASYGAVQVVGSTIWGQRHSFASPPELFCMDIVPGAKPTVVSALSGMPDCDLQVQRLRCAGDGGTPIEYFLLRRRSWQSEPMPTLLWIHGGPVSSWTDGWHWRWNPLPFLAAGYQIALPNPRGSTGYGQLFIDEVCNNQWGAACFRDLMAVADDLCANAQVQSDKLVAMGGSFGGYMSNWIGTQTERFAAIITHASVYRFSAFHGTTDLPAYWALHMGLCPSDNEQEYNRYSPHTHVDNWKTPVLITHGEKDYRVPISESLMLFEDLQRRGVPASLLVFPDENHWILKPRNSQRWYQSCLDFLSDSLGA